MYTSSLPVRGCQLYKSSFRSQGYRPCFRSEFFCRAVTTAVANRTADMSQSQPLNSATTDQPPPPSLENNPHICPRTDTVKKLAALLDEKRVVHVRGTPSSGKTTLAILLWEYYHKRRERVVFFDGWHNVSNPRIHLVDECRARGYSGVEPLQLPTRPWLCDLK